MIKTYLFGKARQVKNISWFLGGFFFGCQLNFLCIIALILAVALDFLSVYLSEDKQE